MKGSVRAIAFALLFLLAATSLALTVQLTTYPQYCASGLGTVSAYPSGGVPPYTYLWSNAETTQGISVPAGTYSVTVTDNVGTQVTDQAIVPFFANYPQVDMPFSARAYCDVPFEPEYAPSILDITGLQETTQIWVQPPLDFGATTHENFINGLYQYVLVADVAVPGSSAIYNYVDGTGCTGSLIMHFGYPVSFPALSVLAVQGTCGTSTGSILVATTEEGSGQGTDLDLRNTSGQMISQRYVGIAATTQEFTGLAPGDYWLSQHISYLGNGSFGMMMRGMCGDSIMVTVPDLGPGCGNVSGRVYMDYNENCAQNAGDVALPGAILEFTPGPYYATANSSGNYSINLTDGPYSVQQIAADIAQHCPAPPAAINVTGVHVLNIADTALVPLDLQVMMSNGPARPGFELQYAISQENLTPASTGSTTTTMTFDPAATFISASPAGTVVGNTITWNQGALGAFQQRNLFVSLQVPPDIGLIGTVLNASATTTTANTDVIVTNNSANTYVTVTASYDPNEKVAATSSLWSSDLYYIDVDEWIDYTIRFQNTGTDTAFTVIVTDTLPATLDPATIQWGAASHTCMRSLQGAGIVKFIFPNILLPDSNVNEPASHGFASFRIKPKLPLLPGTVIENTANIFFDYNDPVITEPNVLTAEFSTSQREVVGQGLRIFPNPATDALLVSGIGTDGGTLLIHAADGRLVRRQRYQGASAMIDLRGLPDGPYELSIEGDGKVVRNRFIKIH